MDLNAMMGFDHVILVRENGAVEDARGVYGPEVHCEYAGAFEDAQILEEHDRAMSEYIRGQGWELETGWSGQYLYSGPIMHPSEYIGGAISDHIRETPGYWVALVVEIHPEDENADPESVGWALAYKEVGK
ncbi:hypothetical protein [Streptomyces sp. NPDC005281]|uniref:hypothetical protein n=1 Tax=Streptomyces sp. NPDC005281 TaxID=3155712 RepID=UPI0033AAFC8F